MKRSNILRLIGNNRTTDFLANSIDGHDHNANNKMALVIRQSDKP